MVIIIKHVKDCTIYIESTLCISEPEITTHVVECWIPSSSFFRGRGAQVVEVCRDGCEEYHKFRRLQEPPDWPGFSFSRSILSTVTGAVK